MRRRRTFWTDWFRPTGHRYRYDAALAFWEACLRVRSL